MNNKILCSNQINKTGANFGGEYFSGKHLGKLEDQFISLRFCSNRKHSLEIVVFVIFHNIFYFYIFQIFYLLTSKLTYDYMTTRDMNTPAFMSFTKVRFG